MCIRDRVRGRRLGSFESCAYRLGRARALTRGARAEPTWKSMRAQKHVRRPTAHGLCTCRVPVLRTTTRQRIFGSQTCSACAAPRTCGGQPASPPIYGSDLRDAPALRSAGPQSSGFEEHCHTFSMVRAGTLRGEGSPEFKRVHNLRESTFLLGGRSCPLPQRRLVHWLLVSRSVGSHRRTRRDAAQRITKSSRRLLSYCCRAAASTQLHHLALSRRHAEHGDVEAICAARSKLHTRSTAALVPPTVCQLSLSITLGRTIGTLKQTTCNLFA